MKRITMLKTLALLLVISLLLVAGCSKKIPIAPKPGASGSTGNTQTVTQGSGTTADTEADIASIDSEIDNLDTGDSADDPALDSLDQDLNLDI